jgi:hypothetical protein
MVTLLINGLQLIVAELLPVPVSPTTSADADNGRKDPVIKNDKKQMVEKITSLLECLYTTSDNCDKSP